MTERLPIVLIPGLACSARLYAPQLPALWQLGPVSVADHTAADTMEGIARSILDHAPRRFHVIGLSMICFIAYEMWRQAPERIASFAMLNTSARGDRPEQAKAAEELLELAGNGRFSEVQDRLFPWLVHSDRHGDPEMRALVDQMAEETGADAFMRQQRALLGRRDLRAKLNEIRCPTLVITGDGDRMTPPKVSKEISDAVPGARLEIVADCGHLSTIERPAAATKLLVEWCSA